MKVNRNNQFQAQFSGMRVGQAFGPSLVVAESVFFSTESNTVVATVFPVICTQTDANALATFINGLASTTYADATAARRAMPRVTTLSIGTLMRTYEKETEQGVNTLQHNGSFASAFRTALNARLVDGHYTLQSAQEALNAVLPQCPTQTIMPARQCAVRTTRGGWVAWLDFNCN